MALIALGELALRVNDLPKMKAFYRDVVGLEVFNDEFDFLVFFKVSDLVPGHPQLLALFDRSTEVGQTTSTLDHFAFSIAIEDLETEKQRLEAAGVDVFPKEFPHFGWRSVFFYDPEGNTLEFVAYDASLSP
jgi:catechol 2,3-dioxygenase-like lactoylglutathione lyase family enzyme